MNAATQRNYMRKLFVEMEGDVDKACAAYAKARSPLPVATISPKTTRGRLVTATACVKDDGQRRTS